MILTYSFAIIAVFFLLGTFFITTGFLHIIAFFIDIVFLIAVFTVIGNIDIFIFLPIIYLPDYVMEIIGHSLCF